MNALRHDSIKFLKRKRVMWGSYLQVETELRLLKDAINYGADYYHLVSGACLPIKPLSYLERLLNEKKNAEYVHVIPNWTESISIKRRYSQYHFLQHKVGRNKGVLWGINKFLILSQQFFRTDRTKANKNTRFYGGMQWFSITSAFAKHVVQNEKWIKSTFGFGLCVDEIFIQTLLMNSPFAGNIFVPSDSEYQSGSLRFVDWKRGRPYTWTEKELKELCNNGNFFARKFAYNTPAQKALTHQILDQNST